MLKNANKASYSPDDFEPEITFTLPSNNWLEAVTVKASEILHISDKDRQVLLEGLLKTYADGSLIYWQRTQADRALLTNWLLEAMLSCCIHNSRGESTSGDEFQHILLHVTDHIGINKAPQIEESERQEMLNELEALFIKLVKQLNATMFECWDYTEWDLSRWPENRPPLYEMLICNMFKAAFVDNPDEYMKSKLECIHFDNIYADLFSQEEIKNISWLQTLLTREGKEIGIMYPVWTDRTSFAV